MANEVNEMVTEEPKEERKYITFLKSYFDILGALPGDDVKALLAAIYQHVFEEGHGENLTGAAKAVYLAMEPNLDSSMKKADKNKKNGAKKGQTEADEGKAEDKKSQTEPNGSQKKPNGAKREPNGSGERKKEKGEGKKEKGERSGENGDKTPNRASAGGEKTQTQLIQESELSDPTKAVVIDWLEYKEQQHKFVYQSKSLGTLLKQIRENETSFGQEYVRKCIETAMGNGWKGISWSVETGRSRDKPRDDIITKWANA